MKNIFQFRNTVIREFQSFSKSFTKITARDIAAFVQQKYEEGIYWPEAMIQINPNYKKGKTVQELVSEGILHPECAQIFRIGKPSESRDLRLFLHQEQAIAIASTGESYVLTSGTGSGKSLAFFIPIIDRVLKEKEHDPRPRTRAIIIYPMNALANSQLEEIGKFLADYPEDQRPVSIKRYTGQESVEEREDIAANPPDILLTNFMMLELIMTRYETVDLKVLEHARGLEFLVLDELHTYRGRQGADVAMLVRRLKHRLRAEELQCIGTSATMVSTGKEKDRAVIVAAFASKLFGTQVKAGNVISEPLERITDPSASKTSIQPLLKGRVIDGSNHWDFQDAFAHDPLAIWVELTMGLELPDDTSSPRRAKPMKLSEAAKLLATEASVSTEQAREALESFLLAAQAFQNEKGQKLFAFKLHQFISGPGKVLCTLEPVGERFITLSAQRYAPGSNDTYLYPVYFCRECGQEYFPVMKKSSRWEPRAIDDPIPENAENVYGYFVPIGDDFYYDGQIEDLPDSWLEQDGDTFIVKNSLKKYVPQRINVDKMGNEISQGGVECLYIPGKLRFCPKCGFEHEPYGKDSNRLASLSGEGRSTASTILTYLILQHLYKEESPDDEHDQRKLLGFTDNRQDAALQSGHFNDFIFMLMLRSGLVAALQRGQQVLPENRIAHAVFKAIGFDSDDPEAKSEYLRNPEMLGFRLQEARKALEYIMGYRIMLDFGKEWRFNNPSLEQLDLVRIHYSSLESAVGDESFENFTGSPYAHRVLKRLGPSGRYELFDLILGEMRKRLCIKSIYLDRNQQQSISQTAYQYLKDPWNIDVNEQMACGAYLVLEGVNTIQHQFAMTLVSGGPQSRLVRLMKKDSNLRIAFVSETGSQPRASDYTDILSASLEYLYRYGFVHKEPLRSNIYGWRLNADCIEWKLTDETEPQKSRPSLRNAFFRSLYPAVAKVLATQNHSLFEFESHEHTAQVDAVVRQKLEARFKFTPRDRKKLMEDFHEANPQRLPVLFCSPTMELGVDISSLSIVYMRNIPPTPANYAQRGGRAGRSGQAALVFTYCASQSPHDQWYFLHADEMVHGAVKAPTLDLANRQLVESHIHAEWLAAAKVALPPSIRDAIDLDNQNYPLKQQINEACRNPALREKAYAVARAIADSVNAALDAADEAFDDAAIQAIIDKSPDEFDKAFDRWRGLYRSTMEQLNKANSIVQNHAVSKKERDNAQRLYNDSKRQLDVLLSPSASLNTDFYSYRYLASQGFLPGYNFPRLPLMAWIPSRGREGEEESGTMVSRPRFLGISEFGPRSLIYHEGRVYRVIKAKLGADTRRELDNGIMLSTKVMNVCPECGHGHLNGDADGVPLQAVCEYCAAPLDATSIMHNLYRIETVETTLIQRITINDEERQRQGYDMQTVFQLARDAQGRLQYTRKRLMLGDRDIAKLTYAPTATIWRINKGWKRRKNPAVIGFMINPLSGTWSKEGEEDEDGLPEGVSENGRLGARNQRIVPFVEDVKNMLIVRPSRQLSIEAIATVEAALARGIMQTYQIEESELATESLPTNETRKSMLFYEAAEGGAGVLSRLASNPYDFAVVARAALQIMHFDVDPSRIEEPIAIETLLAQLESQKSLEDTCVAACYKCLLSYYNQPEHVLIDRRNKDALELLCAFANADIRELSEPIDTGELSSTSQVLEQILEASGCIAPDAFDYKVSGAEFTCDALYKKERIVIFTDDPPADALRYVEERGYRTVVLGGDQSRWAQILASSPIPRRTGDAK